MQEKLGRSHAGKAAAVSCRKSRGGLMQEKLRRSHAGKAAAVSGRKAADAAASDTGDDNGDEAAPVVPPPSSSPPATPHPFLMRRPHAGKATGMGGKGGLAGGGRTA